METIRIRGHHLLCLVGFRGLGYSKEHADAMWRAKRQLFSSPSSIQVILQTSPDDICKACPWLKDGTCHWGNEAKEAKVSSRDHHTLSRLGLKCGVAYRSEEVRERLGLLSKKDILHICNGCHWLSYGYCLENFKGEKDV